MQLSISDKRQSNNSIHFFYNKGTTKKLQFCSCSLDQHKKEVESLCADEAQKSDMYFFRNKDMGHHLYADLSHPKVSLEDLRLFAGKIYKRIKSEKVVDFSLSLDALPVKDKLAALSALCEGFMMSDYEFVAFKEAPKVKPMELHINFNLKKVTASHKKTLQEATTLAEGVNFARWMGDCPGNFMTPDQMAEEAKKAAKGTKMKVTVWNKDRIAKEKMDSLIGVSNGSAQEPRFIIMEYNGAGNKKPPICFVGKGLTFDCGGISMKPPQGMEEMKFDMCGGSAVIAAMGTIAKLNLKVNVLGLVPASENMPGPAANKPGDIRKARNGKSIEINNTDAEGRLILADALCYASEKKPAWIVDVATLTGAMMIALGNTHTGFFTRNSQMTGKIKKAGESSGEEVWHMPLCDHHSKDMKGHYADLTNLAPSRNAGSATAAAFLENFVEKDIPWAHFDIAGTAWHVGGRQSYAPNKGASGVMVRTFVEMAKQHK
jgi:leucyl aminopeptidase